MKIPLFRKGDTVKHEYFDIVKEIIAVYEEDDGSFSYSVVGPSAMHHIYTERELEEEYELVEFY